MPRKLDDWLGAYIEYASHSEAPKRMHFWAGVSAVAGALRGKCWIDMGYFKWQPNFYIVFVAPPGIVSKSTTVSIATNLLRKVPGIQFGPDSVTWQSLITSLAASQEVYEWQGKNIKIAPLTLESSEFGNLIDPKDTQMVDLLVTLWDGRVKYEKMTKTSGSDSVENPWINLIACTTPSWIQGNFPKYMVGGGFSSRCIFVYADKKQRLVAYPSRELGEDHLLKEKDLVHDLIEISTLKGPFTLTPEAIEWGEKWYGLHYTTLANGLDTEEFGGYRARKQTHIHKTAMVLCASRGDDRTITREDLITAEEMVRDLEREMQLVFAKVGKNEKAETSMKLLDFIKGKGKLSYEEAFRYAHTSLPSSRDLVDILLGLTQAGHISIKKMHYGGKVQDVIFSLDAEADQASHDPQILQLHPAQQKKG